jgi:hypothetical protein
LKILTNWNISSFFFSYTCCIFITKQLQLDRIKLNSFSCFGWVYYFCFFSLMLSVLKKHFDCLSWLNNLLGKESFSICLFFLSPLVLCFFWKKIIVCDEKVLRFLICWVSVPQKWKKAKNSNGVYLMEFAEVQPKIIKKWSKHQINRSKQRKP